MECLYAPPMSYDGVHVLPHRVKMSTECCAPNLFISSAVTTFLNNTTLKAFVTLMISYCYSVLRALFQKAEKYCFLKRTVNIWKDAFIWDSFPWEYINSEANGESSLATCFYISSQKENHFCDVHCYKTIMTLNHKMTCEWRLTKYCQHEHN